ncbi:MAG: hypothetical protein MZV63_40145 [Marinilabiliales bacterium]|nr:hypothetical protein [Marinilabiliales bacterium]
MYFLALMVQALIDARIAFGAEIKLRRAKAASFQRVRIPPGELSLQPVATGAVVEVTKRLIALG